jgi:hypothetical protein
LRRTQPARLDVRLVLPYADLPDACPTSRFRMPSSVPHLPTDSGDDNTPAV